MPSAPVPGRVDLAARLAFFLSGAAGLIYEVCWIRRSTLVFGSTIYALSTVLAVFFLGLALGSWGVGALARRSTRPLRIYAALEIGLAVVALATLPAFDLAGRAFVNAYSTLAEQPAMLALARAGLVAAIVLPPSVLMGGTLPLLVQQFVRVRGSIGRGVARLYALNTLGAAAGCALAGTLLIPTLGVRGGVAVGAALNVAAALLALSVRAPAARIPEERSEAPVRAEARPALLAVLFFLAGFTALAYEVLWTRHLALVVHNTVLTYTLTLTVVLAGIVLGSWLASLVVDRTTARGAWFGALQAAAALAVLATLLLPPSVWRGVRGELQAVVALMLPAAVLAGASFPIGVRMAVQQPALAGAGVGWVTAVNTLGGIAGSLVAGFLLLPRVGLHAALLGCTGLGLATGLIAWWGAWRGGPRRIAVTVAVVAAWALVPFLMGTRIPHDFLASRDARIEVREGLQANLAVVRRGGDVVLEIDRWWQGQRAPTQQIMAAHIPMLLHPDPRRVLIVGAGAGQTPSRVTDYPIERLDCVDIEPAVFDLIRRHFDAAWLDDPRVRLVGDDGHNLIARTTDRYDVISVEVGQIFRPGVPLFYTTDFYRMARARLNPHGLVSQLVKLSMPPAILDGVIASFLEVFPDAVLWYNTSEFLLIGANGGTITLDRARFERLASSGRIASDLAQWYYGGEGFALRNPPVFLGGYVCGAEGLRTLAQDAAPFRQDPPRLDYLASGLEPSQENVRAHLVTLRRVTAPMSAIAAPPLTGDTLRRAIDVRARNLAQAEAESWLVQAAPVDRRTPAYEQLVDRALAANPDNLQAVRRKAESLIVRGREIEALPYLERALVLEPRDYRVRRGIGAILAKQGKLEEAEAMLREAEEQERQARRGGG